MRLGQSLSLAGANNFPLDECINYTYTHIYLCMDVCSDQCQRISANKFNLLSSQLNKIYMYMSMCI